ncbi:MAG: transposase [Anaerolineae bacterium]|nr:transposase [Anaerolineae bacterium]
MVELIVGTLLARGRRTVAAALRSVGKSDEQNWSKYHHVLNRAKWSGLHASSLLLNLIVITFVPVGGVVTIAVDETLERRWGPRIRKRGHWHDSRSSSKRFHVSNSGLRWLVLAVVVRVPWTSYAVALSFLSVLLTTPKVSEALGKPHRTVADATQRVVAWLRRALAGYPIRLVGDGAYAVIKLGLACQAHQVTLILPLRMDARLFEPPCRPLEKRIGRPPVVGARLPSLQEVASSLTTQWHRSQLPWYGGGLAVMDWTTGTARWYSTGKPPLVIRWGLIRDPAGIQPLRAFFSTDIHLAPSVVVAGFVDRWTLEVTYEESRAHLGIETQRQWSDLAIERTTPALFGLFSLVVLMTNALFLDGDVPCQQAAWYPKSRATFHDLLFSVRQALWLHLLFQTDAVPPDLRKVTPDRFLHLLFAVCY